MIRKLEEGFRLFELEPAECLDSGKLKELEERYGREEGCRIPRMPMQVHDILTLNRVIEDPALCGRGEECMWVSDRDWAYVCPVRVPLEEAEKYQGCGLAVWIHLPTFTGMVRKRRRGGCISAIGSRAFRKMPGRKLADSSYSFFTAKIGEDGHATAIPRQGNAKMGFVSRFFADMTIIWDMVLSDKDGGI